jgi:hypothetical protein
MGLQWGVEDIPEALDRNAGLLKILPQLDEAQDRITHPPGQHVEGDELPDGELSPHDQRRPDPHQGHGCAFVEPRGDLPSRVAQQRGAETGTHIFR